MGLHTKDIIQKVLLEANGLQVQFHAHFWGKFILVEEFISDEHHFFAKASSSSLDRRLSHKEGKIFLHLENDAPLLITEGLNSFLQNPHSFSDTLIFDARPSYESLFTSQQMYISDFRDPEDFEEVEAYLKLIRGIDKHFDGLLGITSIQGEEKGEAKYIQIKMGDSNWDITIQKELFDMEVLHSLNRLLQQKDQAADMLHLSINSKMHMVILKLDQKTLAMANRMGLIV